jgi:hypothetical protein
METHKTVLVTIYNIDTAAKLHEPLQNHVVYQPSHAPHTSFPYTSPGRVCLLS